MPVLALELQGVSAFCFQEQILAFMFFFRPKRDDIFAHDPLFLLAPYALITGPPYHGQPLHLRPEIRVGSRLQSHHALNRLQPLHACIVFYDDA